MGIGVAMLLAACGTTSTNANNTTNATAQTPQTTQQVHVEVKTDGTYTVKEYDFESNGKNLYARAFVPDVEGRVPLVIVSHGLGANVEHEEEVQKALAKAGITVFSLEFAGGSSSSAPMSEGTNDRDVCSNRSAKLEGRDSYRKRHGIYRSAENLSDGK